MQNAIIQHLINLELTSFSTLNRQLIDDNFRAIRKRIFDINQPSKIEIDVLTESYLFVASNVDLVNRELKESRNEIQSLNQIIFFNATEIVKREPTIESYQKAIEILGTILNFSYSKDLIKQYSKFIKSIEDQEAKNEKIYQSCLLSQSPSIKQLKLAIQKLKRITHYKNSQQLLDFYQVQLVKERKLHVDYFKWRYTPLIISMIISMILTTIYTGFYVSYQNNYASAVTLIEQGNYQEAQTLIEENIEFKNRDQLMTILNVSSLLDDNDYERAIEQFKSINGTVLLDYDRQGGTDPSNNPTIIKNKINNPTKPGYLSGSWEVDSYDFDVKENLVLNLSLIAQYSNLITYTITYHLNDGINHSNNINTYTVEDNFQFKNPTKEGYAFLNWYLSPTFTGTPVINTTGMTGNISLYAKWVINSYTVSLLSDNTQMGTVYGSGTYQYQKMVNIIAMAASGYYFIGWYNGQTLVSSNSTLNFLMPASNLNYVAKFSTNSYELTLTSNDVTKGTVSGSGTYLYGSEVTATATELAGYEFIGWYESTTLKSTNLAYTFNMPFNNLSLEARFVTQYNVDISSFDEALGTVSGGGAHGYTTSVTITATPTAGNRFVAWYDDSFNTVSTNASYTFTMPEYNVTYYAEFTNVKPVLKGDTYIFGTYPQSKVTDSALLSSLNSARGTLPTSANSQAWTSYGYYISGAISSYMWYIDLTNSGDEYRGVYFTSYRPYFTTTTSSTSNSYQDDNGYTTSSVYWFKYEPITWRVLDVQAGKAFLMANLVLDSQDYHYSTSTRTIGGVTVYSNNYKESHIRSWLNDNFYNTAFSTEEKARIQTTTVDNSVASTGYSSNPYACANTSDKIFLLSYVEATNAAYNLGTNASRQLGPSDYAKSQGVYTYGGYNYWWLRSPNYSNDYYARFVGYDGNVYFSSVNITFFGVVPALWISL